MTVFVFKPCLHPFARVKPFFLLGFVAHFFNFHFPCFIPIRVLRPTDLPPNQTLRPSSVGVASLAREVLGASEPEDLFELDGDDLESLELKVAVYGQRSVSAVVVPFSILISSSS